MPYETQTGVIGQTAKMLRLFHEHICRLNLICFGDINNETLMKILAEMNNATLMTIPILAIKIPYLFQ